MFPATILVPLLINNRFETNVVDIALVLLTSGLGTICFIVFTKGKIPAYIGSSFAFIGLTIFLISSQTSDIVTPQMAYTYVCWAYIFAGVLLLSLSFIYRFKDIGKILSFILPAPIVGPAISLIGLELADTAAADSGFQLGSGSVDQSSVLIAISTLVIIILMAITRRRFLKNAAIIVGMISGYIIAMLLNGAPLFDLSGATLFKPPSVSIPILSFPPNIISLFISVIPATLIVFTENIGRITIITRMTNGSSENQPIFNSTNVSSFRKSVFCHGLATLLASLLGSVPNTIYAENIAVMGIHSTDTHEQQRLYKEKDRFVKQLCEPFSYIPFLVAAIIAILVSFLGFLQTILLSVPKPVIGGIELFLFGIISAPGIQLLVEQRVNYKKISNQILTASVLISGISGLTLDLGYVELKGMSLGFVVGVVLNLIINFLRWIGRLNDHISFDELLENCMNFIVRKDVIAIGNISDTLPNTMCASNNSLCSDSVLNEEVSENIDFYGVTTEHLLSALTGKEDQIIIKSKWISSDFIKDVVKNSTYAAIGENGQKEIVVHKTANSLYIYIKSSILDVDMTQEYLNDYRRIIDLDSDGFLRIPINGDIPMRAIKKLLKQNSG